MKSSASKLEELFEAAIALGSAEARASFLDRECPDAPMRKELESLLASHDQPDTVFAAKTIRLESSPSEDVGSVIGRYKLLEALGEGGFGSVWLAEQREPVRRKIALKIIKLGMDTKQIVARFEAERQALALMDHPNIAKVIDAGVTETGRSYFVMELVRGIPITRFCDENKLRTQERLELFIKVCHAIQHAHQKGIIHRDIKPSNVLVTLHDGVPVPKVIDFGIAKATQQELTEQTIHTQFHQFVGTPAYVSPEQAEMSGLDIDTRSDIYSLGVLLYELLAGSTPFDAKELMASGIDAMRKTIREKEPMRPSTRVATLGADQLTTTAKRRSADTSKLMRQLQGDLDWIVMKCLEKDRQRRYETANGLAADLKRHLGNEPVIARPPSQLYRLQKAYRRNRLASTAAACVLVAMVIAMIFIWVAGQREGLARVRESIQRNLAEQRRIEAEANEKKAVAAQVGEAAHRQTADEQRKKAEAQELAARQRAYAADMNLAQQALGMNNLGRALHLLNRQRPLPGEKDLRGWEWRHLWGQTRSDASFTLCQEPAEIFSLAASEDGNCLAVGSFHQGGLAVWDLRTRQELVRLVKNEAQVRAAFSPTEPLLAFAGSAVSASSEERTTLHLWNSATRQMVAELPLDNQCVGLAFARDGRSLVTSTREGHITLHRVPDGTKLASFPSEQFGFGVQSGFAANSELSLAVYTLASGRIRAIDLRNGRELWTVTAAKEFITALAFSPDGKTLASAAGYTESLIRLWDAATGRPVGELKGHGSWVGALAFWPDGKKLASSSADQTIRIWDVASHKELEVLRGHRLEVWRLALLPDAKTLVSGGKDGTVCFWDTSIAQARQPHGALPTESIVNASFAPDGRSILTLDQQGRVAQWAGTGFQQKTSLIELGTNVFSACFSDDGRFLAAHWTNGILQVWDLAQRLLVYRLTNAAARVSPKKFLPDGRKLITWSERDNLLHEWDLPSGVERQLWPAPLAFDSVALSPDGRHSVSVGREGHVILRNLADKSQSNLDLDILEGDVGCFSPDGKLFAIASSLGYARVWETATWRLVANPGGFLKGAHTVTFSADGRRLAVGSGDHEAVKLWDTESWQDVFTLQGQGTGYIGTWFSPDGNTILWGNQTGVLYIWHAPSWEEIRVSEARQQAESKQP